MLSKVLYRLKKSLYVAYNSICAAKKAYILVLIYIGKETCIKANQLFVYK